MMETNIPEDIWEEANAFQKTGEETHTDNQRMSAMSGFIEGAMRERSRNAKKQAELLEKMERFLDRYFYVNENQGRAWRTFKQKVINENEK